MSKLHGLVLFLGLLVTTSPALAQPVRVRAPAAQDFLTTAGECSARIAQPHQRNLCFACVNRGGRFHPANNLCEGGAAPPPPPPPVNAALRSVHECNAIPFGPKRNRCVSCVSGNGVFLTQGGGYGHCQAGAPPPPPPPPVNAALRSVHECNAIHFGPKRNRCISCVSGNGVFLTQGGGHGFCQAGAPPPPPPPPPPPVDRTIQRTVHECNSEIPGPEKRLRCTTCVEGGGTYYKNLGNGLGQCSRPTPPAETSVLRTVSDCTAYVRGPRRARCVRCIQSGGTFLRHEGAGECTMPAPPPPPPPPVMLRSVEECAAHVAGMHQRRRCLKCVGRGATYRTDSHDCIGAPPPPPPAEITSLDECKTQVLRHACRKCVKRGGRWDVSGACRY